MPSRSCCAVLCLFVLAVRPLHAQTSVTELNEAGWKLIDNGEPAGAARFFADALVQRPDEPVLLFGASVSLHLQDRSSEAKVKLRRALEVNPRFTPASLLLGEILYREGDLDHAIKTYETALAFAPSNRDLIGRLRDWHSEADVHGTFSERQQGRFSVMFDGGADAALAVRTTQTLNGAFERISKELRTFPSDPITVILYTQKQFRDITRAPQWAGGLYDGQIRIPVAGAARAPALFERVLVHELTHAMIASIAPRGVPTWLHEGLAQHFTGADVQAARSRLQAQRQFIPLEELEQGFSDLATAEAVVAYDESLVAVSAMIERTHVDLARLLYALAEGASPDEALPGFGVTYSELDALLAR